MCVTVQKNTKRVLVTRSTQRACPVAISRPAYVPHTSRLSSGGGAVTGITGVLEIQSVRLGAVVRNPPSNRERFEALGSTGDPDIGEASEQESLGAAVITYVDVFAAHIPTHKHRTLVETFFHKPARPR